MSGSWLADRVADELSPVEFAVPGPLRERLLAAVEAGTKTATSSLLLQYEIAGEPLPRAGDRGVAVDSARKPCFIVETTEVAVVPLAAVSLDHAVAEGEGYHSVEDYRAAHEEFWTSPEMRAALGDDFELSDDTLVVLERFKVVR